MEPLSKPKMVAKDRAYLKSVSFLCFTFNGFWNSDLLRQGDCLIQVTFKMGDSLI